MDKTKLVGYYRVSSGRQEQEGNALERYRESLLDFGVPESRLFYDVESGASETRKGFNAMIRLIKLGGVSGCVIPYQSRLARSVKIWAEFSEMLIIYGVSLYDLSTGAKEPVDLTSASGEFINFVKAAQAQMMRTEVRQHALDGHEKLRKEGKVFRAPFGYVVNSKMKLEPDESLYFDSEMTCFQIARWLICEFLRRRNKAATLRNAAAKFGIHKAVKDRPCSANGFTYWLNNPALQGHTAYFYDPQSPSDTKIAFYNTHTALISASEAKLLKLTVRSRQGKAKSFHSLAGITFCSECDGLMNRRQSVPRSSRIDSLNKPWGERKKHFYLTCKNACEPKSTRKHWKKCSAKKWHRYGDIKQRVIDELVAEAKKIGLAAGTPDKPSESNEARMLANEIAKLEALNMPDVEDIIQAKRAQLQNIKKSTNETDLTIIKEAQALAAKSEFWLAATDDDFREMLAVVVDKVTVFPDGSVSMRMA